MKILTATTQKTIKIILAFAASAAMLTAIQPPFDISLLAWIALVPFVLACHLDTKAKSLYLTAYFVSVVYWLGNLYWIMPVTWIGWLTFCLYTAGLWPILVVCLRYCRAKKIPLFLAVPVLFVGAERLQGLFLGGFYWRLLAHSQYQNIALIQIADIFGAAGVSFLIAMVNGLASELIIAAYRKKIIGLGNFLKAGFVCCAVLAAIIYGRWRISESDGFITKGPLVSSVQSNVPQSVKESHQDYASEQIFNDLLENSNAAAEAGAELIVWPETMVQAFLDRRVLIFLDSSHLYKVFDKAISENALKNNVFILAGASGGCPEVRENEAVHLVKKYNSAFLYKPDGRQADKQYNKIHLVPFGEVVPFRSVPIIYNLLMKFTPYNFDYSLDYGTEYTVFNMKNSREGQQDYKFGVMICYEDTIPLIGRRFALDKDGHKRVDWLTNISNDGWFVRFENGKVFPRTELTQHAAACVFRAVENRLAILRAVNTGISCLIDTNGCMKKGFLRGNLPDEAMARKGMAGWFVDKVPIDKRCTIFSKYGQWLDLCCAAGVFFVIITSVMGKFIRNKG